MFKQVGYNSSKFLKRKWFIDKRLAVLAWSFLPYFYSNIEYKTNYMEWRAEESLRLFFYEVKISHIERRSEYEQQIFEYYKQKMEVTK